MMQGSNLSRDNGRSLSSFHWPEPVRVEQTVGIQILVLWLLLFFLYGTNHILPGVWCLYLHLLPWWNCKHPDSINYFLNMGIPRETFILWIFNKHFLNEWVTTMNKLADTKGVWSGANCLLRETFLTSSSSRAKWFQGVGTSVMIVCQKSTVPSSERSKSISLWVTTPSHLLLAKGRPISLANPLSLPEIWNLSRDFRDRKELELLHPSSDNLMSLSICPCYLDCHNCLGFCSLCNLEI